jgi:hypothetical protein
VRSEALPSSNDERPVAAHYEEIRSRVVAGRIRGVRRGLTILLQMGMATWLETASSCPPVAGPVTRPGAASSETRLPDERCPALVDILANLALNRFMEVHA